MPCLYAIGAALDPNPKTRLGCTWDSFINHEFFSVFDFDELQKKHIEPIFIPSSEKTNFDATYDLEELLLEEAPLEARARRQKPRERLKDDATKQEIREDELYRMIERDFRPFDYTLAAYQKYVMKSITPQHIILTIRRIKDSVNENGERKPNTASSDDAPRAITTDVATPAPTDSQIQPVVSQSSSTERRPSDEAEVTRSKRTGSQLQRHATSDYITSSSSKRHNGIPNGSRVASPSGGVQVTLDSGGSWSQLARRDTTLPRDANIPPGGKVESSGGMFGFLKGKKGRTHSPKPKERGVLGKEGARVVIA